MSEPTSQAPRVADVLNSVQCFCKKAGTYLKKFGKKLLETAQVVAPKVVQAIRTGCNAIYKWWKKSDTYQQRARGWAVSGFVFSLLNLFTIGCLPPLSYLAVVFCVVALCRGNRAFISLLGIAAGLVGIVLSTNVYETLYLYATNGQELKLLLEGFMTEIQTMIAEVL